MFFYVLRDSFMSSTYHLLQENINRETKLLVQNRLFHACTIQV